MLASIRQAARQLARKVSRESGGKVLLVTREIQADEFGRIQRTRSTTTVIHAVVRYGGETESFSGPVQAGDCVLTLDASQEVDPVNDRVIVNGTLYQIIKTAPDAAGGLSKWHCQKII